MTFIVIIESLRVQATLAMSNHASAQAQPARCPFQVHRHIHCTYSCALTAHAHRAHLHHQTTGKHSVCGQSAGLDALALLCHFKPAIVALTSKHHWPLVPGTTHLCPALHPLLSLGRLPLLAPALSHQPPCQNILRPLPSPRPPLPPPRPPLPGPRLSTHGTAGAA